MTWNLKGKTVLLPGSAADEMNELVAREKTGEIHSEPSLSDVRCMVQQLGGEIAFAARPPEGSMVGDSNPDPSTATHEYVRDGKPSTTLPSLSLEELLGTYGEAREEYAEALKMHARTAYIPEVTATGTHGPETRYFGKPWMPKDVVWPTIDEKPVPFVMQLNVASLPGEWSARLGGSGTVLFFHNDQTEWREDQSDNRFMSQFVIIPEGVACEARDTPEGLTENLPLQIISWKEVTDHPFGDDLHAIPNYEEKYSGVAGGVAWFSKTQRTEAEDGEILSNPNHPLAPYHNFGIDKLGGWPAWLQGNETPDDPRGGKMEYIMQIGYEGLNLPAGIVKGSIQWPTWGRGHIFRAQDGSYAYIWADS